MKMPFSKQEQEYILENMRYRTAAKLKILLNDKRNFDDYVSTDDVKNFIDSTKVKKVKPEIKSKFFNPKQEQF